MGVQELGEFGLIRRIERAVNRATATGAIGRHSAVALGMGDDAALLRVRAGEDLAVSTDAFVEGVHFQREGESPVAVGRRCYAAALSDLAAMGAQPLGYLFTAAWPETIEEAWIEAFARGLSEDQDRFGIALLGGASRQIDQ